MRRPIAVEEEAWRVGGDGKAVGGAEGPGMVTWSGEGAEASSLSSSSIAELSMALTSAVELLGRVAGIRAGAARPVDPRKEDLRGEHGLI